MRRRALLGTVLSVGLAGCGWAQEDGGGPGESPGQGSDGGDPGGGSDDDDEDGSDGDDGDSDDTEGSDGESENGVDTDDLASSEGGEDPIEKDAEALVLRLEDLEADGWEETNAQATGTCSTFERQEESRSFSLESCASVYDDEQTAADEYQGDLDRSRNLMSEELDVRPAIGDEASVVREGAREGKLGETTFRLLFRDSNAVGRIDYTDQQGLAAAEREEIEPISPETVVELGALMHDRWRE